MNRFFFNFGWYLYSLFVVLWLNFCGVLVDSRILVCVTSYVSRPSRWQLCAQGNEQNFCERCLVVVRSLLQILIILKLKYFDTFSNAFNFFTDAVWNPLWQIIFVLRVVSGVFKFQNYIEIDDFLCGLGCVWSTVLLICHLVGYRIAISLLYQRTVC